MSTLEYEIVDVFTDRPFAGNPLAVVYGADGLGTDQLHALAREFNLSETVFVLPPADAGATYRARIFTPEVELPFAGHPSVGAAVTSLRRGLFAAGTVTQECGAGLLPIDVTEAGRATLTGGMPTLGGLLDPGPLLAMVGLSGADFGGAPPQRAGCGLEFVYLPVVPEAVSRAAADPAVAARLGVSQISVFSWDETARTAHARVFCPGVAVAEDPATGSAALGLGVWLVAAGWLPGDGSSAYTVRQGVELRRPSVLDCTVRASAGFATTATVAGHVQPVARGEIAVPPFVG
ncbi:PhzF family phenazine biosynthesis protein [Spirilliplanes yamanashiensis]|uniref:Phenazine antibiotic biosynthesis-like protein n=1 Tax=Spirilliplanes yamanashiensis TaxID=42233 RepID=A0A8J3Y3E7_9ACTN|nr:PhzF family phenazine biosynthesis protein [Spirilliplanes yamanashiensis]MDP9814280.1 trans-2,3-dihydro-3-hydroxyanthranilate isomerase [Spirilliplanes yamanashiensis]GIJ00737.1 phenazine antibiotic biosynthesis-like protein [Spirilliplanes yamanashiensis]